MLDIKFLLKTHRSGEEHYPLTSVASRALSVVMGRPNLVHKWRSRTSRNVHTPRGCGCSRRKYHHGHAEGTAPEWLCAGSPAWDPVAPGYLVAVLPVGSVASSDTAGASICIFQATCATTACAAERIVVRHFVSTGYPFCAVAHSLTLRHVVHEVHAWLVTNPYSLCHPPQLLCGNFPDHNGRWHLLRNDNLRSGHMWRPMHGAKTTSWQWHTSIGCYQSSFVSTVGGHASIAAAIRAALPATGTKRINSESSLQASLNFRYSGAPPLHPNIMSAEEPQITLKEHSPAAVSPFESQQAADTMVEVNRTPIILTAFDLTLPAHSTDTLPELRTPDSRPAFTMNADALILEHEALRPDAPIVHTVSGVGASLASVVEERSECFTGSDTRPSTPIALSAASFYANLAPFEKQMDDFLASHPSPSLPLSQTSSGLQEPPAGDPLLQPEWDTVAQALYTGQDLAHPIAPSNEIQFAPSDDVAVSRYSSLASAGMLQLSASAASTPTVAPSPLGCDAMSMPSGYWPTDLAALEAQWTPPPLPETFGWQGILGSPLHAANSQTLDNAPTLGLCSSIDHHADLRYTAHNSGYPQTLENFRAPQQPPPQYNTWDSLQDVQMPIGFDGGAMMQYPHGQATISSMPELKEAAWGSSQASTMIYGNPSETSLTAKNPSFQMSLAAGGGIVSVQMSSSGQDRSFQMSWRENAPAYSYQHARFAPPMSQDNALSVPTQWPNVDIQATQHFGGGFV